METIFQALVDEVKKSRVKVYSILNIPLDVALANEEIIFAGSYIFVLDMPAGMSTCQIKFNEYSNDPVDLQKQRVITTPFTRLYFNTSVAAGGVLKLAVGVLSETFDIKDFSTTIAIAYPGTPAIDNVTCAAANTEYSKSLGSHCKKFMVKPRGGALKVCLTSGQSGTTYINLSDGQGWGEDGIDYTGTLYFQSPTAGCIVETVIWQ